MTVSPSSSCSPPSTCSPPLGGARTPGQTLVGFAAETHDVRQNAEKKLLAKGADFIVVNDVAAPGVGFEHDTNEVHILGADGTAVHVALTDKRAVADAVVDAIVGHRAADQRAAAPTSAPPAGEKSR